MSGEAGTGRRRAAGATRVCGLVETPRRTHRPRRTGQRAGRHRLGHPPRQAARGPPRRWAPRTASVSPACIIAAGQDRNARAYLADVQHTTSSPAYHSPERILGRRHLRGRRCLGPLGHRSTPCSPGRAPSPATHDAEIRQKILAAAPAAARRLRRRRRRPPAHHRSGLRAGDRPAHGRHLRLPPRPRGVAPRPRRGQPPPPRGRRLDRRRRRRRAHHARPRRRRLPGRRWADADTTLAPARLAPLAPGSPSSTTTSPRTTTTFAPRCASCRRTPSRPSSPAPQPAEPLPSALLRARLAAGGARPPEGLRAPEAAAPAAAAAPASSLSCCAWCATAGALSQTRSAAAPPEARPVRPAPCPAPANPKPASACRGCRPRPPLRPQSRRSPCSPPLRWQPPRRRASAASAVRGDPPAQHRRLRGREHPHGDADDRADAPRGGEPRRSPHHPPRRPPWLIRRSHQAPEAWPRRRTARGPALARWARARAHRGPPRLLRGAGPQLQCPGRRRHADPFLVRRPGHARKIPARQLCSPAECRNGAFAPSPQAQASRGPAFPPPGQQVPDGARATASPEVAPVATPAAIHGGAPAQQAMVPAAAPPTPSKLGLVLAALIALLIAAGATFAFLKLKGL